jgi:hypothetical protein
MTCSSVVEIIISDNMNNNMSNSTMMLSCKNKNKNNDVVTLVDIDTNSDTDSDSDTDQTTSTTSSSSISDDDEDEDEEDIINYDDNDNDADDDDDFDSDSDSSVVTRTMTTMTKIKSNNDNDNVNVKVKRKKVVSFGSIYIRQYERIIGDHPETKVGVPVSIGWKYYDDKEQYNNPISIDEYENFRLCDNKKRGSSKYLLRMSSITRRNMLLHVFDIPEQELIQAEKETKRIKRQKNRSNSRQRPILVVAAQTITGYNKKIGNKIRNCTMSFLKGMSYAAQSGMISGGGSGSTSSGGSGLRMA